MDIVAITLARVAAFLEIISLDPKGKATAPESVTTISEHYQFAKFPKTVEEMNLQTGVTFGAGRFEDIAIDQVQLFQNGVVIDTRSSTDDSRRVLQSLLDLARSVNGAIVSPTRHHLVSQIVFRSELKLSLLNPMLQPIADRLSSLTSRDLVHPITFEPTAVLIGADATQLKVAPSAFTIERRSEAAFSENTYFSAAPISTAEHIGLIEQVERSLRPSS